MKNSTCFETGGLDADRGKPDHQQRMKIHARVEVLPGVPITQAWEVVKHRGAPHLLFSPADGDVAVLIHLDESKITILDKVYGLEAETTYADCLKLSEAIAAKLY